jgi:antirestriction protein ArdC
VKQQERRDYFQELTDKVVAELEKGIVPWHRPWEPDKCIGPQAPVNGITGRPYHGANVLALALSPHAFLTGDPRWCTYQQALEHGYQVRKGEKATTVFFAKPLNVQTKERDTDDPDSPASRTIHMLKAYSVFSMGSQIDGVPPYAPPTVEEAPWTKPDAAQTIIANSRAVVRVGGDRAFYSPSTDHIQLPPDNAFPGPAEFSSVALHEMTHWTGARHRLDRDLTGGFGSAKYSFEELIAEMSSLFVTGTLNLPQTTTNSAAYIGHWNAKLKSDNRAIFKAAAQAQRAADYLLAFHPDYAATLEPDEAPKPLDLVAPASALARPAYQPAQRLTP